MDHLPPEYKELYTKGIHILHRGNLRNADFVIKLQHAVAWMGGVSLSYFVVQIVVQQLFGYDFASSFHIIAIPLLSLTGILTFYYWGWKQKYEVWIWLDHENEILNVLSLDKPPSLFEIPFEEIQSIGWSGGKNGYAIIRTSAMDIRTNRSNEKNEGSVTEMWQSLAKIGAPFDEEWPIILVCPECGETFGHHIGTATCPYDENVSLYDVNSKGRMDPVEMAEEDLDRL